MIYLELFYIFLKIGAFTFGGGYVDVSSIGQKKFYFFLPKTI